MKTPAAKTTKTAAKPVPEAKGKKGGKKDEPAKGPAFEEDADVEADLEGEVEVVERCREEVGEVKAKVKPLRMKVSRAKERALMREFGLDETQLTEEEVAKRRLSSRR